MVQIVTKLLFDKEAGEAAQFYTSIFEDSEIAMTSYYPTDKNVCVQCGLDAAYAGEVMNTDFVLAGKPFTAINGKSKDEPLYLYNEAAILAMYCNSSAEFGTFSEKLVDGGAIVHVRKKEADITIKDRFGVYWRLLQTDMLYQKIVPLFTFSDNQAEEAAAFYSTIFSDAKQQRLTDLFERIHLTLHGQSYELTDDANKQRTFTEAISTIVLCDKQEELDELWIKLTAGEGDGFNRNGSAWLADKYGVWWQILRTELAEIMRRNPIAQKIAIDEMEKSEKIDIEDIKKKLENPADYL